MTGKTDKKLFLLDAMALVYRAYFAFSKNPRVNSRGMNTSAVFGFTNSLIDLLNKEKPSHIAIVFDTAAPTARHEEYTGYKANREAMPEDISSALPYVKKVAGGFRIPVLECDGYEADDVIGTLARQAEKQGFEVFMMTPDKDFGQLVTDRIKMYKPGRFGNDAEVWGVKEVCEKFEVAHPRQVIDILGLWGDAVDNIPGIPGVGEKTAKQLIGTYGSVEELISRADSLKGKLKNKVREYAGQALLSKKLATIITDAPVKFDPRALEVEEPDGTALLDVFSELEFRTIARRVLGEQAGAEAAAGPNVTNHKSARENAGEGRQAPKDITSTPHNYRAASAEKEVNALASLIRKQPSFCFDTETTGLDPSRAELVGLSFAFKKGEAWYVPLPANYDKAYQIVQKFRPAFEDGKVGKTGQNLKFDIEMLKWYDVDVRGPLFDTMVAHYLIQPEMRHNMDLLAETYLGYRPVSITGLIGKKGATQGNMRDVPPAKISEYACEDADITLQLRDAFEPMLEEAGTAKLFREVEAPLIPVLASMESEGIRVNTGELERLAGVIDKDVAALEKEIHHLAGSEFNIASPKQVGEILFEKLKVAAKGKKTKSGQYSTSEDVLAKLSGAHPVVDKILAYRELQKLKNTYLEPLPAMVNPRTGRIHTSFNQVVAATGRLSSDNPNLQNIPVRTERGREIRKAFVPREKNYVLLSADYSQIELRIFAELSGDEAMTEDFRQGHDIHAATAGRIFGVGLDEVNAEMRRKAKMVNFGIIYGISAFGLAQRLNVPRGEAADIISQYFARYPGVKKYMDDIVQFARENGYVQTMLGRRRYLKDIHSGNAVVRGYAERNAINAPVQGSAADMIKVAMVRIFNAMRKEKMKSRLILQVHDELVFDAHKSELNALRPMVESGMATAIPMKVPVAVEMGAGNNWLEAH